MRMLGRRSEFDRLRRSRSLANVAGPAHGSVDGLVLAAENALPVAVFAVLPVCLLALVCWKAIGAGSFAVDFHHSFWQAGRSVLHGDFAYDPTLKTTDAFVYPPLTAVLFAPIALSPHGLADALFTATGIATVPIALRAFGVRDWRCYGAVMLWAPALAAIQAGNLSLLLLGGIALAWALRRHTVGLALVVAAVVSMKLFLWPIGLWLLLTRRFREAAATAVLFVTLNTAAWFAVGAGSLRTYLHLLDRLSRSERSGSYTLHALATQFGLSSSVGNAATWAAISLLLVGWWARGRGDDRSTLATCVLIALVASPIVWLHYLVLLAAPLALVRRTLTWAWLAPILLIFCPGKGNGSALQTGLALAVIAIVAGTTIAPGRRAPAVVANRSISAASRG